MKDKSQIDLSLHLNFSFPLSITIVADMAQNGFHANSSAIGSNFLGIRAENSQVMRSMALRVKLSHLPALENGLLDSEAVSCILCAGWALVLQYYLAGDEVCFGYEENPGITRAMRVSFDDGPTFGEVMERMKGKSIKSSHEIDGSKSRNKDRENGHQTFSTVFNTAVVLRVKPCLATGVISETPPRMLHATPTLPKSVSLTCFLDQLYY